MIDMFTRAGYERLYNIQQGDVWGGYILDEFAPVGRDNISSADGFSMMDEEKYKGKTDFLKGFYKNKQNY